MPQSRQHVKQAAQWLDDHAPDYVLDYVDMLEDVERNASGLMHEFENKCSDLLLRAIYRKNMHKAIRNLDAS